MTEVAAASKRCTGLLTWLIVLQLLTIDHMVQQPNSEHLGMQKADVLSFGSQKRLYGVFMKKSHK